MIEELSDRYKNNGMFVFRTGDNLRKLCERVPASAGVYIVTAIIDKVKTVVYIGASGRVNQKGTLGVQLLNKRLCNMQTAEISRQDFFESKILEEGLNKIEVNWWVTFDDTNKDIPSYVEGLLIQKYFNIHKVLPTWNRKF